jgi:hypothetical protein
VVFGLHFQDLDDVEELEALVDALWVVHHLLQDHAEEVDHGPCQIGLLKQIKERSQPAANQLKEVSVGNVLVYVLAESDLIFFTVAKFEVANSFQLTNVLWKLSWNFTLSSIFELLPSLEPAMNLF